MDMVLTQPPRELLRMPCGLLRQATSTKNYKKHFCLTFFFLNLLIGGIEWQFPVSVTMYNGFC